MELFLHVLQILQQTATFLLEVAILAGPIYLLLRFFRGTRALPVIIGIVICGGTLFLLSQQLNLSVIAWLLTKIPPLLAVALVVVFQPELRRLFAEVGVNPQRFFQHENTQTESETIDILIDATERMAQSNLGALIAVERNIGMRSYSESGERLNARLSVELLMAIFASRAPLHDGAVIVKNGLILSAGCFFPLTESPQKRSFGTRHRAAIGVTEETDAIVLVVSEEHGWVSLIHKGVLVENIDRDRLRRHLTRYLIRDRDKFAASRRGKREEATDVSQTS